MTTPPKKPAGPSKLDQLRALREASYERRQAAMKAEQKATRAAKRSAPKVVRRQ